MLHRGSWLLTAGVSVALLVIAAQHQEWWHRVRGRRSETRAWSLRRRKTALEWVAAVQKQQQAVRALLDCLSPELVRLANRARPLVASELNQRSWIRSSSPDEGSDGLHRAQQRSLQNPASHVVVRLRNALKPSMPPCSTPPPEIPRYPSALSTLQQSLGWIMLMLFLQCIAMWIIGQAISPPSSWTTDATPSTFAKPANSAGTSLSMME